MIHPETHKVTKDNGPRPAGPLDRCLYCNRLIGEDHETSCVCRTKTVVIKYTYEVVAVVPESWDKDAIEFHRNDSSWCSDNAIAEITAVKGCTCNICGAEYLREATAQDESKFTIKP